MDEDYLKKLVVARLKTMPPDVSFSVGSHGDFTRDELIREVMKLTPVGKEFVKMELRLVIESPKIVGRLSGKTTSSH